MINIFSDSEDYYSLSMTSLKVFDIIAMSMFIKTIKLINVPRRNIAQT